MQQLSSNSAQNAFIKLPLEYTNLGLSASEMVVLSQIISLANISSLDNSQRKVCIAFNRTLGKFINRSKYTASRIVKRLKEKGLVAYNLIYKEDSYEVKRRELFPINLTSVEHKTEQRKKNKHQQLLERKIKAIFAAYPKRYDENKELTTETVQIIKDALSVFRQYHLHLNSNLQAADELLKIVKNFASISERWSEEQKVYRYGIKSFMTRNEFTNDPTNWLRRVAREPQQIIPTGSKPQKTLSAAQKVIKELSIEDNTAVMRQKWRQATTHERELTAKYIAQNFTPEVVKLITIDSHYLYLENALRFFKEKEPL